MQHLPNLCFVLPASVGRSKHVLFVLGLRLSRVFLSLHLDFVTLNFTDPTTSGSLAETPPAVLREGTETSHGAHRSSRDFAGRRSHRFLLRISVVRNWKDSTFFHLPGHPLTADKNSAGKKNSCCLGLAFVPSFLRFSKHFLPPDFFWCCATMFCLF